MKRDTFITGPRSRPLEEPLKEAAKFLANQARRFATNKGNVGDVEVAITEWRCALAEAKKGGAP